MIKLGDFARDEITGFEGVVIARAEYLNGCISYHIQPEELKDGSPIEAQWFDEQRLSTESEATAGGPQCRPPELHP